MGENNFFVSCAMPARREIKSILPVWAACPADSLGMPLKAKPKQLSVVSTRSTRCQCTLPARRAAENKEGMTAPVRQRAVMVLRRTAAARRRARRAVRMEAMTVLSS